MEKLNLLKKTVETLKSKGAQITGALALIAALTAMTKDMDAQTVVNKRQYDKTVDEIKNKQENIGEDIAKYLYDGGIKRQLQKEITKQTTENHGEITEDFSIFTNDSVVKLNEKGDILSKEEMTEKIYHTIDSLVEKDVAAMYLLFQRYQEKGKGLVGSKNGKKDEGYHILPFGIDLNIDGERTKSLPNSKEEKTILLQKVEKIYEEELTKALSEAEKLRQTSTPEEYEAALLIARAKTEKIIVARIEKEIADPMIEETFPEYYGTSADASSQESSKGKKSSKKEKNKVNR